MLIFLGGLAGLRWPSQSDLIVTMVSLNLPSPRVAQDTPSGTAILTSFNFILVSTTLLCIFVHHIAQRGENR
ncbi:uncharacterized protein F5147DRAFT_682321 [Suillus discolor]|uniref:Uncharacterized protein n=1 Tax=Suillus discolor TaxID=1912936 RepID=A0A9P7FC23_9AGAM|nr:uncharacterized protein F5147DRAFT_682321 [Suillus discolor]KAG2113019.1 hypothetical protein F5147DRAFT_682321 [Suillus discolor]